MYLKEIRAYGFKSFADKINIELGKNLNGIVGPNGSGKSNIVDAVRWVLGEQSIKSLRGDTSTDVIFSGSKSRKPLNSATVCLIFDNSDKAIPLDFNEVSIKRTLYRSGENEYFINNERVRLKDINELLMDTGGSKESFNIISQGKIDEIVLAKPADRRVIIEEAAGVLKYKKRKEEALRKLDRTHQNLIRINDIIQELELNIEPLKKQSEEASLYLEVKDELKNVEVALITKDIETLNFEYKNAKEKITSISDEITLNSKNISSYDVDIIKLKNKLKEIEDSLNNKQVEYVDLTKKMEQKDADYRLLKERKKYNDNNDKTLDKIISVQEKSLNIKSIIDKDKLEIKNIEEQINSLNNAIKELTDEYQATKVKEDKIKNNLSKNEREIINTKYKIDYLENAINNSNSLPSSVKNILNNKKIAGIHNVIGKIIEFDDKYSLAINTCLMASANYLVVDSTSTAKTLVNYLKENKLGRTTFYPLDVIKPRYINDNIINSLVNVDGFIDIAANLVKYDNIYDNVIKNLLGNVIIASDIDKANLIAKQINNSYKVVTLDGQVINVGGSITGGSAIKTSSVISEKHELEYNKNLYNKLKEDVVSYDKQLKEINNTINIIEEKIHDKKINLSEIDNNYNIKKLDISNKEEEFNRLNQELKDLEAINSTLTDNQEQILLNEYYKIKDNVQIIEQEINSLKNNKTKVEEDIVELEELNRQSNSYLAKKQKELNDLEIKANRMDVRLDNLLLNLSEDYGITFEYAKENYVLDMDDTIARSKVSELKNKLKSIGEVNIGSIEEYERVSTRYNFLNSQKQDLENAKVTLHDIINEMDEVMIDKFKTTFEAVREEFRLVFRELFKGGKAEIILTDPDNLLETGVEIKAEPPGKHLQSISLLSGGEKTFTAISLLFAILNVRPVPFCLLDEVEAALDDANVEEFCKYLNKYRDTTQFILITHKKKTMEYIDLLYGITMQESGVSKLVSVKLEDSK